MSFIVFSDLDGTLLNHNDYSFEEAREMLSFLKEKNIPLIFTTSKTKKECEILQKEMEIDSPFIVENGACIFGFDEPILLGLTYEKIREFINEVKDEFAIRGFSDMSVSDVMEYTGFSYELSIRAKSRDFSEPFLIYDERKLSALEYLAEKRGMKILKGGRFYHCVGIDQDKGKAVSKVLERFSNLKSIGLGDNYNDIDMFNVVDIPVLIPRFNKKYIEYEKDGLVKSPFRGAKGWNESLKRILL
jgi:mannosyl-3-phosphoglycerate phosphatase